MTTLASRPRRRRRLQSNTLAVLLVAPAVIDRAPRRLTAPELIDAGDVDDRPRGDSLPIEELPIEDAKVLTADLGDLRERISFPVSDALPAWRGSGAAGDEAHEQDDAD